MSKKNRKGGNPQSTGTTPMTTPDTTAADQTQNAEATTSATEQTQTTEAVEQTQAAATDAAPVTAVETTQAPTPAPTEAPVVEKPADVVSETTAPSATSMGAVAQPKPALDVSALLREKSDFEQVVDTIIADGTVVMQTLAAALRDYNTVMGSSGQIRHEVINLHQGTLWRVIRMVLNSGEDFEAGLNLLIAFVRNGRDGAFADAHLFRGFEHTRMNGIQSKAFQSVLTLLTTAAGVNNRAQVRKTIDLGRTMNSEVFSSEARTRVLGFFA